MAKLRKPNTLPRKEPAQARSKETVATILQAATRVLAKESLAGFNTNRVAQIAGISVGSLYQYFPNKDALVTALIVAEHESLLAKLDAVAPRLANCDADTIVRTLAKLGVSQQFENPILAAALDHEEARLPIRKLLEQAEAALLGSVAKLARPHYPNLTMIELKDCMTIGQAIVESETGNANVDQVALEQRVYRALSGYLNFLN